MSSKFARPLRRSLRFDDDWASNLKEILSETYLGHLGRFVHVADVISSCAGDRASFVDVQDVLANLRSA